MRLTRSIWKEERERERGREGERERGREGEGEREMEREMALVRSGNSAYFALGLGRIY